jgi:hypothetical protein
MRLGATSIETGQPFPWPRYLFLRLFLDVEPSFVLLDRPMLVDLGLLSICWEPLSVLLLTAISL